MNPWAISASPPVTRMRHILISFNHTRSQMRHAWEASVPAVLHFCAGDGTGSSLLSRTLVRLCVQPSSHRQGHTRRLRTSSSLALECRICLDAGRASRCRPASCDTPAPSSPASTRLEDKLGHHPGSGPLSVAELEEATIFGSYSLSSHLLADFP